MVSDALLTLQAQTTVTATTHGTGLVLPKAPMLRPIYAKVIYSNALVTSSSGTDTVTFSTEVSYDNGSTWNVHETADPITLTTTAQGGEFSIPIQLTRADLIQSSLATQPVPQVRLSAAFSSTAHGDTITYLGRIEPGRI